MFYMLEELLYDIATTSNVYDMTDEEFETLERGLNFLEREVGEFYTDNEKFLEYNQVALVGFKTDKHLFITHYTGIAGKYWGDNEYLTYCHP